jgi:hypothetical protein
MDVTPSLGMMTTKAAGADHSGEEVGRGGFRAGAAAQPAVELLGRSAPIMAAATRLRA